jgi:alkaline phosphatase
MIRPAMLRNGVRALAAGLLASAACAAIASPAITRLTPPSNPVAAGAQTLARFLPGQRFDLQATVRPDPLSGAYIKSVRFLVDDVEVGNVSAAAPVVSSPTPTPVFAGRLSIVPATAITASAPGAVAASMRAYSNSMPGMHVLAVTATDSNGASVTASGHFDVVGVTDEGAKVKNIIILLGDGMGASHRTAARIVTKGYLHGKPQGRLAMDSFPYTGMVMTASLNSIVTDSAPGMANYVNGNKAQNNQEGVFPDDTNDAFDNPRIEYLSEYLHRTKGKKLGIVTTADVFDATPAANAVHTSNRGNGTGIVDQYLDDRGLTGLTVLMGGGRKWFLPNASNATSPQAANGSQRKSSTDYVLPADLVAGWGAAPGKLDPARDLIADFQNTGNFSYAPDKTAMDSADESKPLLGLFAFSNMNVAMDKIGHRRGSSSVVDDYGFPDQPMLDEMTDKALKILSKNSPKGFYLMVEGASIDKQAHLMDSDRWIQEVIEFDRAVQTAKDFAAEHPGTLVIITADHECAGVALIGGSLGTGVGAAANQANVGTYDAAKFPAYTMVADGYPADMDFTGKLLVGYGANADRYESWQSYPQPTQDSQQPFVGAAPLNTYPANPNVRNPANSAFLVKGQVSGDQAVHTGSDIPLSAFGRGASMFSGVFDNTDVFFKIGQAVLGGVPSPESEDRHGDDGDD